MVDLLCERMSLQADRHVTERSSLQREQVAVSSGFRRIAYSSPISIRADERQRPGEHLIRLNEIGGLAQPVADATRSRQAISAIEAPRERRSRRRAGNRKRTAEEWSEGRSSSGSGGFGHAKRVRASSTSARRSPVRVPFPDARQDQRHGGHEDDEDRGRSRTRPNQISAKIAQIVEDTVLITTTERAREKSPIRPARHPSPARASSADDRGE